MPAARARMVTSSRSSGVRTTPSGGSAGGAPAAVPRSASSTASISAFSRAASASEAELSTSSAIIASSVAVRSSSVFIGRMVRGPAASSSLRTTTPPSIMRRLEGVPAAVDVVFEERYWYPDDGGVVWISGFQVVEAESGRYLARDAPELAARGLRVAGVAGAGRHHPDALAAEDVAPGRAPRPRGAPGEPPRPGAAAGAGARAAARPGQSARPERDRGARARRRAGRLGAAGDGGGARAGARRGRRLGGGRVARAARVAPGSALGADDAARAGRRDRAA